MKTGTHTQVPVPMTNPNIVTMTINRTEDYARVSRPRVSISED